MIAGGLEIQLFAGLARLHKDMQDAKRMVSQTMGEVGALAQRASTALGAIGVGVSVAGLLTLTKRTIDAVDALNDLNKSTAIGVRDLAGLGYAAQVSGSNIAGAAAAINKLSQNIGKDAEKYRALGITAKEPIEAFKQLSDLFNSIEDPQLRAALGAEALGKGWSAAAPLLAEGGKRIGELVERGATLSGVTEEMAQQADEFNDKLAELAGTGAVMNRVIGPMLPLLIGAVNGLLDARDAATQANVGFNPFVETLRVLIVVAGNVGYVLKTVATEAGGIAAQVSAMLSGDFERVASIGSMMNVDAIKARQAFDEWERGIMGMGSAAASAEPKMRALGEAERKAAEARARAFVAQEEMAKRAREETQRRYEMAKAELDAEEMFARDYAEAWKWADHYRTEEEKKESKLRQEIAQAEMDAREMALDDFIGAWKAYDEYVRKQDKQRLDEAQQQYGGFINGIESAFRDGWNHIGESWKDALGVMKNAFKRILLDFIYQSLAKPFVLNLLVSLGNATGLGGLTTAATAAGGGGGIGSIISGMSALMPSGAIGTAFSNIAQMVSGALGLSGSVGSMIGSVASFLPGIGTAIAVASMLYQAFNDGPENPNLRIFQGQGGSGLFGGIRTEGNYSWDNTGINAYIGGLDARLARILGPAGTAAATAGLSAYTQAGLRSDGQPAQFAFPEGDATAAEQLAREVLQSRYGIIFQQIDSTIAETIRTWSGTSTELQTYIETALGVVEALGGLNIRGLNITTLQGMAREGETLAQVFQRVAGTWQWFTDNFTSDAVRLERAQQQLADGFAALGMDIPDGVDAFRELVESLDVTDPRWQGLMDLAPAFLLVTQNATAATEATDDLADALERQAEIQRQIEESVRNSRESQLAAIVGARGGLANFLNGTALGGLSPMTPQEKLAEARRQYEEILRAAMAGDLGAAGRLGGAAETYLQIAREMFASGSGYVSIYDEVMGQVRGVDQRLAIDEQILRATLGMATDIAAQTEILIEVKSLLIDIRDKGPAVVAGDTKPR